MSNYELVQVKSPEDWATYHQIRKDELFDARNRDIDYNENHPDEHAPQNTPFLLKGEVAGLATTRFDRLGDGLAAIRLVAVTKSEQGKGLGLILGEKLVEFAKSEGIHKLVVNANPEAVEYYRKMGFSEEIWDENELVGISSNSIQMVKIL